jgi:hypothetical protein
MPKAKDRTRSGQPQRRAAATLSAAAGTAALALGIALLAPAAALADEGPVATGTIGGEHLGLADGQISYDDGLVIDQRAGTDVPATGFDDPMYTTRWQTENPGANPDRAVTFSYRIDLGGVASGYWVKGSLSGYGAVIGWPGALTSTCDIYLGDPAAGGVVAPSGNPYLCDMDQATDNQVNFVVRDNIDAQVRGIVAPKGPVSLDAGYYDLNTPHQYAGALTVPADGSTAWDSILRTGDNPIPAKTASGTFVYRIVDDGTPTPYWIEGVGQNYRGVEFDHTATCEIYDRNPTPDAGSPDPATPVDVSPYSCDMTNRNIDYRGNWEVTFSITKRPLQVVTGAFEQADLMDRYCAGGQPNCGLSLADAHTVLGPGVIASKRVANNTTETLTDTVGASTRVTTTNSVGTTVTVALKISELFKSSLAVTYNYSISNASTYSQAQALPIPPGCESWWVLSPEMVSATGDVIIRGDNDVYYLLKDVSYNFPESDDTSKNSVLTAESASLSGGKCLVKGDGATEPSPPASTGPAEVTSTRSASTAGGAATKLADTGSTTVDGIGYGLFALIGGVVLLIVRSRRRSRADAR